jgi:hypothetical protein
VLDGHFGNYNAFVMQKHLTIERARRSRNYPIILTQVAPY